MIKELLIKYRILVVLFLGIVITIGLVLGFAPFLKDVHNERSFADTDCFVGVVDENNDIVLTNLMKRTYYLYYENDKGIIEDYQAIRVTDLKYTGLVEENVAPAGATRFGVYSKFGWRKGTVALGSLAMPELGEKLYSQGSISDIHLQQETATSDFQKALEYFNSIDNLLFVNICGDLSETGSAEELAYYKDMRDTYSSKPVYAISGNHEHIACTSYDSTDWTIYTGHNLWYTYTQDDDVYIMVGAHGAAQPFSTAELQWLYETLEANRNKRCFVYQHIFPWGGSGDVAGLNGHGDLLDNVPGQVFLSLMSHYKNVIWFHGHSHQEFSTQEQYQMNNIDSIFGRYSVHIPSLASPRTVEGDAQYAAFEASEGYIVDVFENGIVLRGRDFLRDSFPPLATFYLDTTIQMIPQETYCDPTGTIINKNSPEPASLPDGTTYLLNKRYSQSSGAIIDLNGYASFIIPCVADGVTPYTLQLRNTSIDLTSPRTSRYFFLDSDKNFLGWTNGSPFFSEMSGVSTLNDGAIQVDFVPMAGTAFIIVCIEERYDTPISVIDIFDYDISLNQAEEAFVLPTGTTCMFNKRYSESAGGIIDATGFVSLLIPCAGDGIVSYLLKFENTGLNLMDSRASRHFLFDSEQNLLGWANGSPFFSEMSGIIVLEDGTIQLDLIPADGTSYIMVCIAEKSDVSVSILDINDYVVSLILSE